MKTLSSIFVVVILLTSTNCTNNQPTMADQLRVEISQQEKQMYVIERHIPNAGQLTAEQLQGISQTSCSVIDELGNNNIKWLHSYVTKDKVFCVYSAANEELIKEHAKKGDFPADAIVKVNTVIDPSSAK